MYKFFKKDFIYCLERGEGKEKEGEKLQCVVAPHMPSTGDLACSAQAGNWTSDPSVCRPSLNPLSYTSQGTMYNFFSMKNVKTL